jgi:hypothetical protein
MAAFSVDYQDAPVNDEFRAGYFRILRSGNVSA